MKHDVWDDTQLKILLVEDDAVFNLMYVHYLSEKGAQVTSCTSIAEARRVLSDNTFHCMVLDNQLEDGEGIELLGDFVSLTARPAIIFASSNDQASFLLNAFELGVDDYMIKPVSLDLLWIKIKKTIEGKKAGWLAKKHQLDIEQRIEEQQQEQLLARHLFQHMYSDINENNIAVTKMLIPSGIFSGDAILSCKGVDGSWYVMLADAMGHGLTPAISLLPVMQVMKAMATKGLPLSNMVFQLNEILLKLLPDERFVAAAFVRIDPHTKELDLYCAGLPKPIMLDANKNVISADVVSNMALGILSGDMFDASVSSFSIQTLKYVFFYSDGLVEVPTNEGACLDRKEVVDLISSEMMLPNYIRSRFEDVVREDDVSFCLIDLDKIFYSSVSKPEEEVNSMTGMIEVGVKYSGKILSEVGLASKVIGFLSERNFSLDYQQRVFTVVSELFSNSFEHGVLRLDSNIKSCEDGFVAYYEERNKKIKNIASEDYVGFNMKWHDGLAGVQFEIFDSGEGFEFMENNVSDSDSYGRGLRLIKELVDDIQFFDSGAKVRFTMLDRKRIC